MRNGGGVVRVTRTVDVSAGLQLLGHGNNGMLVGQVGLVAKDKQISRTELELSHFALLLSNTPIK